MYCSLCGMTITPDDRLCPRCGADMSPLPGMGAADQFRPAPEFMPENDYPVAPLEPEAMKHAPAGYRAPETARPASGASTPPAAPRARGSQGHSEPPPPRPAPPPEYPRAAPLEPREAPSGPVRVRRAPERPRPKSVQRKVPLGKPRVRIGIILLVVLGAIAIIGGVGYYVLTQSMAGQMQLAAWGYEAPAAAYWQLGDAQLRDGYVPKAIQSFQKALETDKGNIDGYLLLGTAYERDGQEEEAIKVYEYLMDELAPEHQDAYVRMAQIHQAKEEHIEALAMMNLGFDKTGSDRFKSMIHDYAPLSPEPSMVGARYNQQIHLKIKSSEGCKIYYTLGENGKEAPDPNKFGIEYTDELVFDEGTVQVRAIAKSANGVPSEEMNETYTVLYPMPNAPKANVAPGKYEKAPLVSIIPDKENKDIVEIHYTLDNTPATKYSPLYDVDNPIRLPLGKSVLRAVVVDVRGKTSYEMVVSYEVKGAVKPMFRKEDGIDELVLMKTTYEQFTKKYGEAKSYQPIDDIGGHKAYRGEYSFGYACFVETEDGGKPVLCELSTTASSFKVKSPRNVHVGSSADDVISVFRDVGGPGNDQGERVLYNNGQNSLGTYGLEPDGSRAIHYYYQRGKNDYAELSFYLQGDTVSRIVWVRYVGQ